ncbi:MAG: TonB family protein [Bacteroidales bacterium]|nr:TonB family protein [Bacteroidales bacterium]
MKRLFTIVCLLLATLTLPAQYRRPPYGDLYESVTVAAMREDVRFLASAALEGRKAGSEGEREAARYVSSRLEEEGVDVLTGPQGEPFGIRQENGDTLSSHNVLAFIPGYDKSVADHYIVIGARLDNIGTYELTIDGEKVTRICYGANGNASGLAMLIQLASMLQRNKVLLRRSVIIAAFGASCMLGAGSWYFLNRSFSAVDKIDAMINLDMLGTASSGFYAWPSGNADLTQFLSNLSATLQPIVPQVVTREPCFSDHKAFYDKEIPSVFFTTGMYPEYNSEKDTESILEYDNMERELEYIYNFAVQLCCGPRPLFKLDEATAARLNGKMVVPYYECDVKPTFLGSTDPGVFLQKWVYAYLHYPAEAVRQGIHGRVLVDFLIDEKGNVKDAHVLKGVHPLLDEEAVKVVGASPRWKPGKVRGKPVISEVSLYVEFILERRKNR